MQRWQRGGAKVPFIAAYCIAKYRCETTLLNFDTFILRGQQLSGITVLNHLMKYCSFIAQPWVLVTYHTEDNSSFESII